MDLKNDSKLIHELTESLRLFRAASDTRTKTVLIKYIKNLIREIYQGKEGKQ